ncbi:MAG: putative porin [Verrucomicrobiia bacterium]
MKTKIYKNLVAKIEMVFVATVFSVAINHNINAQSVDSLLDKLVQKGILTVNEANELKEESDKDFRSAYAAKTGLSEWVNSFKIGGDIRGRYEGFYGDNPAFVQRDRFRYRARILFQAQMLNNFEAGLRLTSGEPVGSFGGDPISGNTTFRDNAAKKFLYVDLAYFKWNAINSGDWQLATTIGKMENPFAFSDMVFDGDWTPEGFGLSLQYKPMEKHALKLNAGVFVLDELSVSTQDPMMSGVQLLWSAKWNEKIDSTLGIGFLSINNDDKLNDNTEIPNVNRGNYRAGGLTRYGFNPIIANGSLSYKLDKFPYYSGAFPITVWGEYVNNPAAPSSADNYGWSAGVTFGKASKRNTYELSYTYKWLGANAWWEEVVDSDFGAYYAGTSLSNPSGTGYYSGTNIKGHIVKFGYSPTDFLALSAKVFFTDLIDQPVVANPKSGMTRLQIDMSLKF